MNPLLQRHLRKLGLEENVSPDVTQWKKLLSLVDQTLTEADQNRLMLEHSLACVSAEMTGLYRDLEQRSENIITQERDKLRKTNSFLDTILENIPVMLFVKDAKELKFVRVNRAYEEIFGLSSDELLGKDVYDFFPKEQADFFTNQDRNILDSKTLSEISLAPVQVKNGIRWLQTRLIPILGENCEPTYLLGISLDITSRKNAEDLLQSSHEDLERRIQERTFELKNQIDQRHNMENALVQSEEKLRRAQKMDAIGRLAGGIAHDFNNLLAVILISSEVLVEDLGSNYPMRNYLEAIAHAGHRGADLTHQLLAFTRQQVLQTVLFDINDAINKMNSMLALIIGENVEFKMLTTAPMATVKADPGQFEQIMMNLVINARDAMPHGGKITIETGVEEVVSSNSIESLTTRTSLPGAYVRISVQDTGQGMDRATIDRIFEPFFTTKPKGKGTGLGLSTVLGIIEQSRGLIRVDSTVGVGSTIHVLLPMNTGTEIERTISPEPETEVLNGSETILLVEDEHSLRHVIGSMLRSYGYSIIEAANPNKAIDCVSAESDPKIHLILTDVIMPGMNGFELAEKIRVVHPDIKILFMSGYTEGIDLVKLASSKTDSFIQKPFSPRVLIKRIRETLDSLEVSSVLSH